MIIIIFIIIALILLAMSLSARYYENKLKDMNNCYGTKCSDCIKYGHGCLGKDKYIVDNKKN